MSLPQNVQDATQLLAGLPEPLKQSAWKAIDSLIGGVVGLPGALLQAKVREIQDAAASKSLITNTLAKAAAEKAAENTDLVERTLLASLSGQIKKQMNREGVARLFIREVVDSASPGQPDSNQADISAEEKVTSAEEESAPAEDNVPDDDWLNAFSVHAENASSERLQALWARVLAGEVRAPGSFSLASLRLVSELDKDIAELFEKFCENVVLGAAPICALDQIPVIQRVALQEAGLVNGAESTLSLPISIEDRGFVAIKAQSYALIITGNAHYSYSLGVVMLSRVGRELSTLIGKPDESRVFTKISEKIKKDGLTSISLVPLSQGEAKVEGVKMLWVAT